MYSDNIAIETIIMGFVSVLLSALNVTNIFVGAMLLLNVSAKKVLTDDDCQS